jgi:hypothetical protein
VEVYQLLLHPVLLYIQQREFTLGLFQQVLLQFLLLLFRQAEITEGVLVIFVVFTLVSKAVVAAD